MLETMALSARRRVDAHEDGLRARARVRRRRRVVGGARAALAPAREAASDAVRAAVGDPIVAVLAVAAAAAFGYLVALGLVVPPGQWDELLYHLPRMVLWIQQEAVAAIPGSPGSNLDANPVAAEIPQALTLLLDRSDRFVACSSSSASRSPRSRSPAPPAGSGSTAGAAAYGALLFAFLPAIALQAPTAYVDLALVDRLHGRGVLRPRHGGTASSCCSDWPLRSRRAPRWLGAPRSSPRSCSSCSSRLGCAAAPRARGRRAVAVAAGRWWYAYNLVRTGAWDGRDGGRLQPGAVARPTTWSCASSATSRSCLNLTGVPGNDRYVFAIAAVAIASSASRSAAFARAWSSRRVSPSHRGS